MESNNKQSIVKKNPKKDPADKDMKFAQHAVNGFEEVKKIIENKLGASYSASNFNTVLRQMQKLSTKSQSGKCPIQRKCYCCQDDDEAKQNYKCGFIKQEEPGIFLLSQDASKRF